MADLALCYTSALELARRIREGAVSVTAVVENSLARIDAVNRELNCFCFTYPDEALARAQAADAAVAAGAPLGPLHGVPIAFKDLTPTRGKTTTMGSYVYRDWVPDRNAAIVDKLLGAGAILVGKTTTPEFAHAGFTASPLWGTTRNPWDARRSPGGSSGGSAVAVATGCVPLAEGSDMGGSVRIPAAWCGIVGLKPSFGRIPFDALPTQFDSLSHFGPLARTVSDAALFLGAAQGPDERDIQTLSPPLEISLPLSGDIRGLRLGLSMDLDHYAIDDEVAANTQAAVEVLEDLGARVEEVELGWTRAVSDAWCEHWCVYLAALFGQHLERWRDRMDPVVVTLLERGLAMSAVDFKRLEFVRTEQWKKLAPVLERCHALLCPTMRTAATDTGLSDLDFVSEDAQGRFLGLDLTAPFNLVSQCPALTVPSGFTGGGLPTGLQIVGRRFDDLGVLRVGQALEDAVQWTRHRPPI